MSATLLKEAVVITGSTAKLEHEMLSVAVLSEKISGRKFIYFARDINE